MTEIQKQSKILQQSSTPLGGKEAVLKRLLETQEIYIQELEAKCKSMSDQLTETPMKNSMSFSMNNSHDLKYLQIDTNEIQKQKHSFLERIHQLINHYESANRQITDPLVKNLIEVLTILKQEAQIELEVYQQRDQQHQGLIKTMQHKFSKERQDFVAQFQQTETLLQQKVLGLEQEVAVLKNQVKKQTATEEDLNTEVLHELETLEARYKQSDEELRQENSQLRKQLAGHVKQVRELQSQLITTKQQLDMKNFEQFTQLKRLEDTLKQIRSEVKQAHRVLETNSIQFEGTYQTDLNEQLTSRSGETFTGVNLQKELEVAHQEIEYLRQNNMNELWQEKFDLVEKEKKVLADELQKIAKGFQQREATFVKDLKSAQQQIKQLTQTQSKRETQLQSELQAARSHLHDFIAAVQITPASITLPDMTKSQEYENQQNQIEHLKTLHLTLRQHLQECWIQQGRCTSMLASSQAVDKHLAYATQQHKLTLKVQTIQNKFFNTLEKVEQLAVDLSLMPPTEAFEQYIQHTNEYGVKVDPQVQIELTQAKKSLMMYINKCNQLEELLDSDLQMDQSQIRLVLIKKFAIEINQLKQELQETQHQRDEYQNQLKAINQQQKSSLTIANSTTRELEQVKIELRSLLNELRHCMTQFQDSEAKLVSERQKSQVKKSGLQPSITKEQIINSTTQNQQTSKQMYDEIVQLRNQIDEMSQNQEKRVQIREAEIASLVKATQIVVKREEQLTQSIKTVQQIAFALMQDRGQNKTSDEELHELNRQIDSLKVELREMQQKTKSEVEAKYSILTQKLQLLEAQKEVLIKELEHYKLQCETMDGPKRSYQIENDRLKKHILSRQLEIAEMRQKTQQMQKQIKQKAQETEQEMLKKYKDRLSGHLKVFDLELSKLQSIVNVNIVQ